MCIWVTIELWNCQRVLRGLYAALGLITSNKIKISRVQWWMTKTGCSSGSGIADGNILVIWNLLSKIGK